MRKLYLVTILLLAYLLSSSQAVTQLIHYSVDDGLSENHVLCMLQDRNGMMWFGTFDGLNKFDGYSFRSFKGGMNPTYQLINYRIDRLKEDHRGFLWIQTNDGRIYRFDTSTETFLPVPQCIPEYSNFKTSLNRINVLSDGSIWLYSTESGNDGCFKVENIETNQKIKLTHFTKTNGDLSSNKINKIFQDKGQNTWVLTSKGISFFKKGNSKPIQMFTENQGGKVFSICESQTGFYIGGEHGKLRILDKKNGTLDLINTSFESNIIDIQLINLQEISLLTNNSDFYIYNTATKLFQTFRIKSLSSNIVHGCYKDRSNNIWIDSENPGAILFDSKAKTISYLPVETNKYANSISLMFSIVEDKFDNIWVQIRPGGFYKYNKETKRLEPISNQDSNSRSISDIVHTAMSDNQGNLWVSTYLQGIDKIVFRQSPFIFTKPFNVSEYTSTNEIRSVYQDSKKWLWVGSKKGFVYVYNERKEFKGMLGFDGKLNSKTPFNVPVYDIKEDHTGTIWLATKGMGLFRLLRRPNDTFAVTNYQYDPKNIYSISSNSIYSVFEDHLHQIWIGTFLGGLNLLEERTGDIRFINNRNKLKNYPINDCFKVRYITEDSHNNIFLGTTQGLVIFKSEIKNPEKIIFYRYVFNPKNPYSLSGNDVQYVLPSKKGNVYFALNGGGINVLKGGFIIAKTNCTNNIKQNVHKYFHTHKDK